MSSSEEARPAKAENHGVITAGYIFAVLVWPVGFIIGLTQINKPDGIKVLSLSVVVAVVSWLLVDAGVISV